VATLPLDPPDRPAAWTRTPERYFVPVPQQIAWLRSSLEADPGGRAAEILAMLPIEDHQVPPQAFHTAVAEGSDDVRLWVAIAEGRLGEFAALDTVLADLAAGPRQCSVCGRPHRPGRPQRRPPAQRGLGRVATTNAEGSVMN
jgi:hypothetical protein